MSILPKEIYCLISLFIGDYNSFRNLSITSKNAWFGCCLHMKDVLRRKITIKMVECWCCRSNEKYQHPTFQVNVKQFYETCQKEALKDKDSLSQDITMFCKHDHNHGILL